MILSSCVCALTTLVIIRVCVDPLLIPTVLVIGFETCGSKEI